MLTRVATRLGARHSRYIDVERICSTPERILAAVARDSPSADNRALPLPAGRTAPRAAFEALLAFLEGREDPFRVLLLDEWLELRTLESFPGLRGAMRELVEALARSPRRFVLASRFMHRTRRLLDGRSAPFELVRLPPLSPTEVVSVLPASPPGIDDSGRGELGRLVHALTAGRPSYVGILAASLSTQERWQGDPVGMLVAQMAAGAPLSHLCRFSYELRLHRARGYGALKAILGILADVEPLTLTEIARRLGRTPGSTKDYLSWLEDVDLIEPLEKRYRFADPLLRLWVRLHTRPAAPGDRDRAITVHEYASARLAPGNTPVAPTPPPLAVPPRRPQDLIEID